MAIRSWRRTLIVARGYAMPTMRAMAYTGFLPRGADRLWIDGGSVEGFHDCVKLGWLRPEITAPKARHPLGNVLAVITPVGRAMMRRERQLNEWER